MERIPMTCQGYEKLRRELEELKDQLSHTVSELGRAREFGDVSDNAEFDAAKEELDHLQSRIREKEDLLARAFIVDETQLPRDRVVLGARVRVVDLDLDEEEEYHFVSQGQEDYMQNKILITSPIGQGLVGKKVGEVVEIPVPQGTLRLKIIDIKFDA